MKASYKCDKCGYKWNSNPKQTICPKCNHLYVEWLNYKEWRTWADTQGHR